MFDIISAVGSSGETSTATTSKSAAQEQRDQFLQLLTYQLKAQNPLKPYDNQEFASQLAQFSQLEQLTEMRSLMEEQGRTNLALSKTMSNSALPGMLGKSAVVETNHITLKDGENATLGYTLPINANSGQVEIYDSAGNIVRTIVLDDQSNMRKGDNTIQWDGKADNGNQLSPGTYTYYADFLDSFGSQFSGEAFTKGPIESVRFKNDGTVLLVGGMEISLDKIREINN
ncbi:MAG: flagellar hook capping FlgD N-terminal domain-containing protein [Candidatus Kapaibacteriales bacterium]